MTFSALRNLALGYNLLGYASTFWAVIGVVVLYFGFRRLKAFWHTLPDDDIARTENVKP